jgi:hypothetical protein
MAATAAMLTPSIIISGAPTPAVSETIQVAVQRAATR